MTKPRRSPRLTPWSIAPAYSNDSWRGMDEELQNQQNTSMVSSDSFVGGLNSYSYD